MFVCVCVCERERAGRLDTLQTLTNTVVSASFSTETLEFLETHYDLVHEASWLIILYQVLIASLVETCVCGHIGDVTGGR